jgi:hypothetical protein
MQLKEVRWENPRDNIIIRDALLVLVLMARGGIGTTQQIIITAALLLN